MKAAEVTRKLILLVLFVFSVVGIVFASIFSVVNISEIPGQISGVHYKGDVNEDLFDIGSSQGDADTISSVESESNTGFIGFFRSISLDLSGITPILLLWFFLSIGIQTFRYYRGKVALAYIEEKRPDTFPLPLLYKTTWIQLGFIGTLWGFLLIGIRMKGAMASDTGEILDILLKAFGTALLSTFTAVVLAYAIGPLTTRLWQWCVGVDSRDRKSLEFQLGMFAQTLNNAIDTVGVFKTELDILKAKISEVSPKDTINKLDDIANRVTAVGSQVGEQQTALAGQMAQVVEGLGETRTALEGPLQAVQGHTQTMEQHLTQTMGEVIGQVRADVQAVAQEVQAVGGQVGEQQTALAGRMAQVVEGLGETRTALEGPLQAVQGHTQTMEQHLTQTMGEVIGQVRADVQAVAQEVQAVGGQVGEQQTALAGRMAQVVEGLGETRTALEGPLQAVQGHTQTIEQHLTQTMGEVIGQVRADVQAMAQEVQAVGGQVGEQQTALAGRMAQVVEGLGETRTALEGPLQAVQGHTQTIEQHLTQTMGEVIGQVRADVQAVGGQVGEQQTALAGRMAQVVEGLGETRTALEGPLQAVQGHTQTIEQHLTQTMGEVIGQVRADVQAMAQEVQAVGGQVGEQQTAIVRLLERLSETRSAFISPLQDIKAHLSSIESRSGHQLREIDAFHTDVARIEASITEYVHGVDTRVQNELNEIINEMKKLGVPGPEHDAALRAALEPLCETMGEIKTTINSPIEEVNSHVTNIGTLITTRLNEIQLSIGSDFSALRDVVDLALQDMKKSIDEQDLAPDNKKITDLEEQFISLQKNILTMIDEVITEKVHIPLDDLGKRIESNTKNLQNAFISSLKISEETISKGMNDHLDHVVPYLTSMTASNTTENPQPSDVNQESGNSQNITASSRLKSVFSLSRFFDKSLTTKSKPKKPE